MGPKAKFSFDRVLMDAVFIHTEQVCEVVLENESDIPAAFSFSKNETLFGPLFTFSPSEGILDVAEQRAVQIRFKSHLLGSFDEKFRCILDGGVEPLTIAFAGNVVGPTFNFDCEKLELEKTSYGFSNSQQLSLFNTSSVPMQFQLSCVDQVDGGDMADFTMIPPLGEILPHSTMKIELIFSPSAIRSYACDLMVDVDGVGTDLLRLPISAQSLVPEVLGH